MSLPVNYQDDLLDTTQNTHRRYNIKKTSDDSTIQGDVYLEEITEYEQEGSNFGAQALNATNSAINLINSSHDYTITTTGWVANTNTRNNDTYTVMQEIVASEVADANLDALILSATSGAVMTEAEREAKDMICGDIDKSENGFYVYAEEATTTALRIRLKGV